MAMSPAARPLAYVIEDDKNLSTADDRKAQELYEMADLVLFKPVGFEQLRDMAARLHAAA